jgi:hypothetical protein
MTIPELTPEEPETTRTARRLERLVEGSLVALVLVMAAVLGIPQLFEAVRDGDIDLAAVFYPVLLVAFGVLAWTRRDGQ